MIRLTDGNYIPNYRYFLLEPEHGENETGTCGAVAAQLMLSYHNYYSDRRIIADNLQALVTMDLVAGKTYFIIVSTYNITTTSGVLNLSISKKS